MKKISGHSLAPSKNKLKRPGVHAKTKQSKNKGSALYKKPYNKQGK